jgi:hypothetical protein
VLGSRSVSCEVLDVPFPSTDENESSNDYIKSRGRNCKKLRHYERYKGRVQSSQSIDLIHYFDF